MDDNSKTNNHSNVANNRPKSKSNPGQKRFYTLAEVLERVQYESNDDDFSYSSDEEDLEKPDVDDQVSMVRSESDSEQVTEEVGAEVPSEDNEVLRGCHNSSNLDAEMASGEPNSVNAIVTEITPEVQEPEMASGKPNSLDAIAAEPEMASGEPNSLDAIAAEPEMASGERNSLDAIAAEPEMASGEPNSVDGNLDGDVWQIPIWSLQNKCPQLAPFTFTGQPGLRDDLRMQLNNEFDYLKLFITDELMESIKTETNRYGNTRKLGADKPHARMKNFTEVSEEDIWRMLALTFQMGVVKKPSISMYWSEDTTVETPFWPSIMSRNRYMNILTALHFQDNTLQKPDHDRLWKIRPFYDYLTSRFSDVYTPDQSISIDESLLLYKGRLSFKQYIPLKRSRFGLKSYEVVDSSGYTFRYRLYTGQDRDLQDAHLGISYSIVMHLVEDLAYKGYTVTMDNYYSSPILMSKLYDMKTNAFGTVRQNRKGMPTDLILKEDGTELCKGDISFRSSDKLFALCWRDKKFVTMLSNCHDGTVVNVEDTQKPKIVLDYNKTMGSVDRVSQLLEYYSFLRKTIKWYKKLVFHLIDVAILNAYILWNKTHDKKHTQLTFRLAMVSKIIETVGEDPSATDKGGRRSTASVHPLRLTGRHFPSFNPGSASREICFRQCRLCNEPSGQRHQKGQCRKRTETKYMCRECGCVPLCAVPCFRTWHTNLNVL